MKQKAFILTEDTLAKLQCLLDDGWTLVHSCPMPNSVATANDCATQRIVPTCFLLLQK